MKSQSMYRSRWTISVALALIFVIVGCTGQVPPPTLPAVSSATAESSSPTQDPAASPTEPAIETTAVASQPSTDENVLYRDDFTNKATGWPEADFGDYFIGYHEPEYYHVEIKTANAKAPVVSIPDPENNAYPDATIELQAFTVSGRTATDGDYRYGLAFRRSGDNYYAFTISPTTKKWEVLKSSPSGVSVLQEGVDQSIHDLDVDDLLRVDAQGPNFSFSINNGLVGQITDSDYADGEIGFYTENLSNTNTHVHFNALTVRNLEAPPPEDEGPLLYRDDFTNKATGWPEADFGDYFIGYHEPEYYHVEIKTANAKAPVVSIPDPENNAYPDATIELQAFTVSGRTATDGDYRYGLAFRRSGDNYYAFTISPTTKKWEVLKSSPSGVSVLQEGVDQSIHDLDVDDLLRVDAQGPNFLFSINDVLVGQVVDSDYADGEIGFYTENLSNTNTHVHFNTLSIRSVKFALLCSINEGGTVNVRTGPGQSNATIGTLSSGDTVRALGKSSNNWIQIVMEGSDAPGWVSYSEGYMTCSPSVDLFPLVNP